MARCHRRWAGIALLIACTLSLSADQQKDTQDPVKEPAKKAPEKLTSLGEYTGLLINLEDDQHLTVKVTLRFLEPNPSAVQQQQNLMRRQVEIMQNRNPVERQRQLAQLAVEVAQNQRNLYTSKEVQQDVRCQAVENIKVRTLQPPLAFDDRGNPRKYSAKELKELKGSGNLPGYASSYSNLRTGQTVTVHLAGKKEAGTPKKGKDPDKELERKLLETDTSYVTMIVIVSEPIE
jgi:hypothetical protein